MEGMKVDHIVCLEPIGTLARRTREVENQRMEEMHKLKIELGDLKQVTVRDFNTIDSLNRVLNMKDELIASLRVGVETLEKANLLLENNLKILQLSKNPTENKKYKRKISGKWVEYLRKVFQ